MPMSKLFIKIILLFLAFFFIFLSQRRKYFLFFGLLSLSAICYLCPELPDMKNYTDFYNAVGQGNGNSFLGYGWLWLCQLANLLHLNYLTFKTILYFISLLFLVKGIGYFSQNKARPMMIYLLFPGLLDLIQIRFLFATSIVVIGIGILFTKEGVFRYLGFLACLMIAFLFHNSVLFYFLFIFIPYLSRHASERKLIFAAFIILILLILLTPYYSTIARSLLPEIQANRIDTYLEGEKVKWYGLLVYALFFITQLMLIRSYRKLCIENIFLWLKIPNVQMVLLMNVILLFSLPLVYLNSDFLRIQRAMLVINYSLLLSNQNELNKKDMIVLDWQVPIKTFFGCTTLAYIVLFYFAFNPESISLFLK